MSSVYDFIEELGECYSLKEIHAVCTKFCKSINYDYFHYGAQIPVSFSKPVFVFVSGYPDPWWERYTQNNYLYEDPTVIHCANHVTPFFWQQMSGSRHKVINEAREFGLHQGISVPVHGATGEKAIFSVACEHQSKPSTNLFNAELGSLLIFASFVHETVRRVIILEGFEQTPRQLTRREKECLLWAAEGKTTWETSQILNIAESTVTFHLSNAVGKLNVANKSQAVARAVVENLISPFSL
ncbi:MAG: LuxR family transcriptional regulator [Gammaproteobacteria bacterium]|nr:LuxR family transcriptional regulator [Gammaproteobacteria bacterium]